MKNNRPLNRNIHASACINIKGREKNSADSNPPLSTSGQSGAEDGSECLQLKIAFLRITARIGDN